MNRYFQEKWSWIEGSHLLRAQVLDMLSDADLAFNPGRENVSLGALCREMGDVEHSYTESLKTFQQDWSCHNSAAGLESSVAQLKTWFQTLDAGLQATVAGLSDDDLGKTVDRGTGFTMPVDWQLDVYLQALLIFLAKATVYLKMMNKPLPQQMREYIG
jgi:hypothetical protein